MGQKIFTPQEANERLPYIRKIVNEILEKGRILRLYDESFEGDKIPDEFKGLEQEIEALLKELENLGCYYKDWNFEIGLVDFPAMINGEAVFLCWRSDEPGLMFYHSMEEGYQARKPIPEELLN